LLCPYKQSDSTNFDELRRTEHWPVGSTLFFVTSTQTKNGNKNGKYIMLNFFVIARIGEVPSVRSYGKCCCTGFVFLRYVDRGFCHGDELCFLWRELDFEIPFIRTSCSEELKTEAKNHWILTRARSGC
jgi:hypothetical protein